MIIVMTKRSYGTGSLFVRVDAAGHEAWYGQWRSGDALIKRSWARSGGQANAAA